MTAAQPEGGPVLVVDDDPDILEVVSLLLESGGYQVRTASDGHAALSVLAEGVRPCLIVLDLMMPGMDGWQFRTAQLADTALADIPVVVLSGAGDLGQRSIGGVEFLTKPVRVEVLLGAVARFCTRCVQP